jgi:16S rRNA (cytosine967-C5)-methyltransferase
VADIAGNQRRVLGDFLRQLRPHWHQEAGLPARIERLIRSDRRLGSRDRRLYRELIYTTLRYLNWIEPWLDPSALGTTRSVSLPETIRFASLSEATSSAALSATTPSTRFGLEMIAWLAADLPATRAFRTALLANRPDPWPSCPATVAEKAALLTARIEREPLQRELELGPSDPSPALSGVEARARLPLPSLLPAWAPAECPVALTPSEYDALHRRAPLWVRLQGSSPHLVLEEFSSRHWPWRRSDLLPAAVRVDTEADLTDTLAFQTGMIEIQDIGSQRILATAAPAPGGRWLDACAGAGGKSLQLADLLGPAGRVEVHDVRPEALAELERRAVRAQLQSRIRRADLSRPGLYDGVLVDAPCSGSGTWRRSPHLKAVTTAEHLAAAAAAQTRLLDEFSARVKPSGRLVYATCSLCVRENEGAAADFLGRHPDFAPETSRRLLPSEHDGDGFFVATFRRLA